MGIGVCRMCGQNGKLIKAHIIPESFYRALDDPITQYSSVPDEFPKLKRVGVYDDSILCERCEATFGPYDNHAVRLLNIPPRTDPGEVFAKVPVDYALMKLFFMSVLWRAHVSQVRFCDKVDLGRRHGLQLQQMIQNKNPGSAQDYSVFSIHFENDTERSSGLQPHKILVEGVRAYHFYLGGLTWIVKVDSRPFTGLYSNLILSPNKPMLVKRGDWATSQERRTLVEKSKEMTESRSRPR